MDTADEEYAGYACMIAATELSIDLLENLENGKNANGEVKPSIGDMYVGLCVLKRQAWAPFSMLQRLWRVPDERVTATINSLCGANLATKECRKHQCFRTKAEREQIGIKIHDLHWEYCKKKCKQRSEVHKRLLDGYLAPVGEGNIADSGLRPWWSEDVPDDNYIHENLVHHLAESGNLDELKALLLDGRWAELRRKAAGILAVEQDFNVLRRKQEDFTCVARGGR